MRNLAISTGPLGEYRAGAEPEIRSDKGCVRKGGGVQGRSKALCQGGFQEGELPVRKHAP